MFAQSMSQPGRAPSIHSYASNPVNPWLWVAGSVVVVGGVGALAYHHYKKGEEEAIKVAQQQQALDDAEGEEIIVEPDGSPFMDGAQMDPNRPQVRPGLGQTVINQPDVRAKGPQEPSPFAPMQAWFQLPGQQPDLGGPFGTGQGKPAGGGAEPWTQGPGKSPASFQLPVPLSGMGWYHVVSFRGPNGRLYSVYMEQSAKGFRWAIAGIGPAAGATASKWKLSYRGALKQALTRIMNYEGWPWAKESGGIIYLDKGFAGIPSAWGNDTPFVRCAANGTCDLPGSGSAGSGSGK